VIDLHTHILPGIDDGPSSWDEALEMARLAAADGIRIVVATPHLFRRRMVDLKAVNTPGLILETVERLQGKLAEADIDLEVLPGCEVPLSYEALRLLEEGQLLTLNNANRYICLEMPGLAIPAATEDIIFHFSSRGLTPIITHPERNMVFAENPEKLVRFLRLGCLSQITAGSLIGRFGRRVARFAKTLVTKGFAHIVASDAHDCQGRPPLLAEAVKYLSRLIGEVQAREMVSGTPQSILKGEPVP
jgi:protein-tyrosine phosphatase